MQIYYINLDSRPDRRARIEQQLDELGLSGHRLKAFSPEDIPLALISIHSNPRRLFPLTTGELACAFSHAEALRRVGNGSEPFGLVLEDDAILSRALPDFLRAFETANPDIDLVKLDSQGEIVRVLKGASLLVANTALQQVISHRDFATGYIVARRAAIAIANHPRVLARPIDVSLYNPLSPVMRGIRVRHADPAMCAQPEQLGGDQNDSSLEPERIARNQKIVGVKRHLRNVYAWFGAHCYGIQKTYRELVGGGALKRSIPLAPDLVAHKFKLAGER